MKKYLFLALLIIGISASSCTEKETLFQINTYVTPDGAGVVTPSSAEVLEGSTVSFKATPNGEYIFTSWSGSISGTTNPQTITVTSDMSVTANFTLRSYPLTLLIEGEGQINEKVISSKADYSSGTTVELTAQASEHWQFSHWEGDLSGSENPAQIIISSKKSVKAVFTKKSYEYSLKIVGPGAVDEEIVETTRATLEAGTIVRLSAYPDERTNAVFKGWSGDFNGTAPIIEVNIDDVKNITATFDKAPARKYELPDLKQPWVVLKNLYHGLDFSELAYDAGNMVAVDYNLDGYIDVVTAEESHPEGDVSSTCTVRFFIGNPDGTFSPDPLNDNRIIGECARKMIYGDYNGDNKPDICIISHGYDYPPYPGSFPLFLMSSDSGEYSKVEFRDKLGYYHAGSSGDIDNDGDVDVLFVDSQRKNISMYINDGHGNFKYDSSILPNSDEGLYTSELFDLDNDGYLDLIWGGDSRNTRGYIIWGNGKTFNHSDISVFPIPTPGCELLLDFEFYDLNNDGICEIIINSTSNGSVYPTYDNWGITVVECKDRICKDVTSQYFEAEENMGFERIYAPYAWIVWIDMEEIDGKTYLTGRKGNNGDIYFEFLNGKFVRYDNSATNNKPYVLENGICIYSDGEASIVDYLTTDCTDSPYSGNTCIKLSDWPQWSGFALDYPTWVDFSYLEKNGYCLEFAIRNTDPDLVIAFALETRIQTEPWHFPSYSYTFNGNEHKLDGTWEVIRIPLSSLKCDDEWTGYYWNTIKTINISPNEYHGKDFYLDEIRIRKAL